MGIGTDTMKTLIAAVAGSPAARAELAAAVNLGNQALNAIDRVDTTAPQIFADSKLGEFAPVRAAEIAKQLDDVINPKPASAPAAVAEEVKP